MKTLHERFQLYGSETLSTSELLALILQTEAAPDLGDEQIARLLQDWGGLGDLMRIELGELAQSAHLDLSKAIQLQAILELAKRLTAYMAERKYQILTSAHAAQLVMAEMMHLDHEQLRVLSLNTKNQVVANQVLYSGTVNSSVLRAAEVFRTAITRKCSAIIVIHNHPSGSTSPSAEDIEVTKQLIEAGKVLDIDMLDHLIIGNQDYLSLKERMRW